MQAGFGDLIFANISGLSVERLESYVVDLGVRFMRSIAIDGAISRKCSTKISGEGSMKHSDNLTFQLYKPSR